MTERERTVGVLTRCCVPHRLGTTRSGLARGRSLVDGGGLCGAALRAPRPTCYGCNGARRATVPLHGPRGEACRDAVQSDAVLLPEVELDSEAAGPSSIEDGAVSRPAHPRGRSPGRVQRAAVQPDRLARVPWSSPGAGRPGPSPHERGRPETPLQRLKERDDRRPAVVTPPGLRVSSTRRGP